MSKFRPNRSGGSLRPGLQALVSHVGLKQGTFKLVVHQGSIQAVIIKPSIRIMIRETASQKTDAESTLIRVSEAEPFVLHLEPLVSDLIGDFGSLKVNVTGGRVVDWSSGRRHR